MTSLIIPTCHKTSEWVLIYRGAIIVHFTRSDLRWDSSPNGPGGTDQLEAFCTEENKASIREDEWPKNFGEWSMVTATKFLLEKLFPPPEPYLSSGMSILLATEDGGDHHPIFNKKEEN